MSPENRLWASTSPSPGAWKVPAGSLADRAKEQDVAAGGRERRRLRPDNGTTATASIALKHFAKTRRVYAYLRYSVAGKTITLYIGDATADCRKDALRIAWRIVHERKLLGS